VAEKQEASNDDHAAGCNQEHNRPDANVFAVFVFAEPC
jgi:hypothetical protein